MMMPGKQGLSPFLIRAQHLQWVDEHFFLPEHTKSEMKQIVSSHHGLIMQSVGAIELCYRRTLASLEGDPATEKLLQKILKG